MYDGSEGCVDNNQDRPTYKRWRKAVVGDENLYGVKDRIDIYVTLDDVRSVILNTIAGVDSGLFLKLSDAVSEINVHHFE